MKNFTLVGGLLALSFFATACIPQQSTPEQNIEEPIVSEPHSQETQVNETTSEQIIEEETEMEEAKYIAYSEDTLAKLKGSQPVAIFFHAEWCSTCRGMEEDINENLASLPKGTVILKADYDTEVELKKEYKIVLQSTIAILDKDGNHVNTLAAPSSSEIVEALNKA